MQDFIDKKILLGVCGGIAAYKSAYLVRELTRLGADVRVVMTQSAQQFISPLLMQALSSNEVRTDLFDMQSEHAMGHIELARWADFLLIVPASANCLAKMAQGIADDLLSTLYLVAETPVIVCPAMNRSMWAHPATQANCELLKERGVLFVGPEEGSQACGEHGLGRVSEAEQVISALRLFEVHQLLAGKKVLITAGPTREAIDPVRYLSNYSSGKMGFALAEAAAMAGAQVTLISGPSTLSASAGVELVRVESAQSMLEEVMNRLQRALAINPQDTISKHMLNALNGSTDADTTPDYAKNLFNNYALYYEQHMKDQLNYSLPQHIGRTVHELELLQVNNTLDIGCGTGLSGVVLREISKRLTGIDIAEKMLAHAREKGIYDSLVHSEVIEFLNQNKKPYDLIVAADVLPYFGDLSTLFQLINTQLKAQGYFIFSTEISEREPWTLQTSARFNHHPDYIKRLANECQFELIKKEKVPARLHNKHPLEVMLYVLQKNKISPTG